MLRAGRTRVLPLPGPPVASFDCRPLLEPAFCHNLRPSGSPRHRQRGADRSTVPRRVRGVPPIADEAGALTAPANSAILAPCNQAVDSTPSRAALSAQSSLDPPSSLKRDSYASSRACRIPGTASSVAPCRSGETSIAQANGPLRSRNWKASRGTQTTPAEYQGTAKSISRSRVPLTGRVDDAGSPKHTAFAIRPHTMRRGVLACSTLPVPYLLGTCYRTLVPRTGRAGSSALVTAGSPPVEPWVQPPASESDSVAVSLVEVGGPLYQPGRNL